MPNKSARNIMKMVLLLRIYYLCVSELEIWHPYILILKLLASMKFCYAEDNHNFFPLFFLSLVWAFFFLSLFVGYCSARLPDTKPPNDIIDLHGRYQTQIQKTFFS